MRAFVVSVVIAGLAGCGPQWPNHATIVADKGFMAKSKQVTTVDVLPLDLQLWTARGFDGNPDELRSSSETRIMNAALAALAERNYAVSSVIDFDGNADGNPALAKSDLRATLGALKRYGSMVTDHPGELPVPFLPARLGESTHSDATLFVGGWAFVGVPEESTASKVAKGVGVVLIVVAAVVIVAAIASALEGDKHSSSGSKVRDHRSSSGGDGGSEFSSSGASSTSRGIHFGADVAVEMIDAFGRSAEIAAAGDWQDDEKLPHEGDSQMYLEMTLVDNHTGLALWHVHQQFPAYAGGAEDVDRVAHTLLASLPTH